MEMLLLCVKRRTTGTTSGPISLGRLSLFVAAGAISLLRAMMMTGIDQSSARSGAAHCVQSGEPD
jgi:hypothetical protein